MYGMTAQEVYGSGGLPTGQVAASLASTGFKVGAGASVAGVQVGADVAAGGSLIADDPVVWVVAIVGLAVLAAWASAH